MSAIFNVFRISQLRKYLHVPEERVETSDIKIESDLAYEEKQVQLLDSKERVTQKWVIMFDKVMWSNHIEWDATWEERIVYVKFTPRFMKNDRYFNLGMRFL